MEKTNVMRILDSKKIPYEYRTYDSSITNGVEVAAILNQDPSLVFKTLVTIGSDKQNYVFLVPVSKTLDLKKAASSVNVKSLSMIPQKELLNLTGYIHGGCSPIGMKKRFKTTIHESAKNNETITFSAGKVGYQVTLNLSELSSVIEYKLDDIIER